ncbi:uncharacterized protein Z520_03643 [Fonsecaea multimorphosa CBS 102226]|uniref:Uncharacterized protein n=1 Tax=Fonsecaea multimorphosa CBS 102226 TaxID=1442371 RepID=A0A0D2IV98_9EURO|nr:uncharacterized protein Z520_03643 [Fonsecaea multimorphosa CBS 102226]KIY00977.1 hypothetical protein Z520_03643 [Fonsecaea multimorphosa CBS 102226]OAL27562.1 hypothetical protein AYO22_03466 [Fonsecaea multimorphosa]
MLLLSCLFLLLQTVTSRSLHLRASEALTNSTGSETPASASSDPRVYFKEQYENPAETFSVLLLIGGDIVQKAIAQLVGHKLRGVYITPTAFSFGWVAYAFSALNSALSDGSLMPSPDIECRVIPLRSQGERENESWIIGRLVRDLEINKHLKMPDEVIMQKDNEGKMKRTTKKYTKPVFTFLTTKEKPGCPKADMIWWSFLLFLPLQLVIAAIPTILPQRNWGILMITGVGSLLAMITGSLPQWMDEKYACRLDSRDTYILTRGNGHVHVFVIENAPPIKGEVKEGAPKKVGTSLNMEDLAIQSPRATLLSRSILVALAVAWVFFLITAGGLEKDTWYLMGVGGLGMVHNVYVANAARKPAAHGSPVVEDLDNCKRIKADPGEKVMAVLMKAEEYRPGVGLAVLTTFFPGRLDKDEADSWAKARQTLELRREAFKRGEHPLPDPWTVPEETATVTITDTQKTVQVSREQAQPANLRRSSTIPSSAI